MSFLFEMQRRVFARSGQVCQVNATHVDQVMSPFTILMQISVSKMTGLHYCDIADLRPSQDKSGPISPRLVRSGQVKSDQEEASQVKSGQAETLTNRAIRADIIPLVAVDAKQW